MAIDDKHGIILHMQFVIPIRCSFNLLIWILNKFMYTYTNKTLNLVTLSTYYSLQKLYFELLPLFRNIF